MIKLKDVPNFELMSSGSDSLPWTDDVALFVKGLTNYMKQQEERIIYLEKRAGIDPESEL